MPEALEQREGLFNLGHRHRGPREGLAGLMLRGQTASRGDLAPAVDPVFHRGLADRHLLDDVARPGGVAGCDPDLLGFLVLHGLRIPRIDQSCTGPTNFFRDPHSLPSSAFFLSDLKLLR